MKPLNRAERTNSFWRFLLLFAVTIGVVMAVAFFSFQVPLRENKALREKLVEMENERELTERFTATAREAVNELAKYETGEALPSATHQGVGYKIQDLDKLLRAIPHSENSIYALAIRNIDDLNNAKKQLRSAQPR